MHGINSIGLYEKRDYERNIPANAGQAANERWYNIGKRLGQAANKVVKQNG